MAFCAPLGCDPLNQPTTKKEPLAEEADTDPDCLSTHEMSGERSSSSFRSVKVSVSFVMVSVTVTEFVEQHAILHPSYRDQIIEGFEQPVSHAVFGDAMDTRIMPDGHLGHPESMHQGQRRKESMHSLKKPNPIQHGSSEDLERASGVVHSVMREDIPHTVRDQGGEFLDETVLPLLPPSAHHVV